LAYRWQSGHFADRANRVALPTRASLDVGVATSTADDRLQLTARVDNLLDRPNFDLIGFPLPGRTMMVTLSWEGQR
jgi:outer membrane cobalamin receptor